MKRKRSRIADDIIQEINKKTFFENYLKRKEQEKNNASKKSEAVDTNMEKQERCINKEVKQ